MRRQLRAQGLVHLAAGDLLALYVHFSDGGPLLLQASGGETGAVRRCRCTSASRAGGGAGAALLLPPLLLLRRGGAVCA